jgi:hypothetical protein
MRMQEMIRASLTWRAEYRPDLITAEDIEPEAEQGKVRPHRRAVTSLPGPDRRGRVSFSDRLVTAAARHVVSDDDESEEQRAALFVVYVWRTRGLLIMIIVYVCCSHKCRCTSMASLTSLADR